MKINEILTEDSSLNLGKLTRRPGRVERFIDLIQKGHQFKTKTGNIQIDKNTIKGIIADLENENSRMKVKTTLGQEIPLGNIFYDDSVFGVDATGKSSSKAGDTSVKLKPADVFKHGTPEKHQDLTADVALNLGAFPASELASRIINNKYLKSQGVAGAAIINIAKQLNSGQVPVVPDLTGKTLQTVTNDGYEYLGVLALLKHVVNFPLIDDFYKHVGGNLDNNLLFFPGSTNNPVADSYSLEDKNNGNQVFISSKAGKTGSGAPSSIAVIRLPEHLQKNRSPTMQFIRFLQQTSRPANKQPFLVANYIHDKYPGSLGDMENFLPFDDDFISYVIDMWNQPKRMPQTLQQVPAQYRKFFSYIEKNSQKSKYGFFLNSRHLVKTAIINAVNSGNAAPGFSSKMLEILGYNFIVLKTKNVGQKFQTSAEWPSKMGGTVELAHKDPPDKWGGAITWILK